MWPKKQKWYRDIRHAARHGGGDGRHTGPTQIDEVEAQAHATKSASLARARHTLQQSAHARKKKAVTKTRKMRSAQKKTVSWLQIREPKVRSRVLVD